ncbi:MAG: SDR family NAD(P)-dependent oxidoreductase [Chloroflexi bacterium]|nr:SDR family NAD(P)-dependent oxidoreductase [Chloroflexota bacterium]
MTNLNGKTALITGANSGLGQATAIELAKRGWHVVMVARSRERGEAAQREIQAASGSSAVELLLADLASQQAIRHLALAYKQQYRHLHLLINNVGNSFFTRQVSPDGIEMSLAVNHLAAFLLTHLLLDTLRNSAPARIVNVGTRLNTAMDLDDLQWERRHYQGLAAYAQSKVGNLHFTFELAQRLSGSAVTVNCVHPGVFRSNLGKNAGPTPLWMQIAETLGRPFLAPAEKAAERVLYVATAPELDGVTGKYFGNRVEIAPPPQTLDAAARARVWVSSERLTGVQSERV